MERRAAAACLLALWAFGGCRGAPKEATSHGSAPGGTVTLHSADAPAPSGLPELASTNDPRVILRSMVAAYKNAQTMQVETEGDQRISGPGAPLFVHHTTAYKYQTRPARLAMSTRNAITGTTSYFADGTSFVVYSGLHNQFTRRDEAGDLTALARRIDQLTPQLLTPLGMILSGEQPRGLISPQLAGSENVDGKPAYVVKAVFDPSYVRYLGHKTDFASGYDAAKSEATLWIDKRTGYLLKSTQRLVWKGVTRDPDSGRRAVTDTLELSERVTKLVPNAPLAQSEFRFIPPKGAQEVYQERTGG